MPSGTRKGSRRVYTFEEKRRHVLEAEQEGIDAVILRNPYIRKESLTRWVMAHRDGTLRPTKRGPKPRAARDASIEKFLRSRGIGAERPISAQLLKELMAAYTAEYPDQALRSAETFRRAIIRVRLSETRRLNIQPATVEPIAKSPSTVPAMRPAPQPPLRLPAVDPVPVPRMYEASPFAGPCDRACQTESGRPDRAALLLTSLSASLSLNGPDTLGYPRSLTVPVMGSYDSLMVDLDVVLPILSQTVDQSVYSAQNESVRRTVAWLRSVRAGIDSTSHTAPSPQPHAFDTSRWG